MLNSLPPNMSKSIISTLKLPLVREMHSSIEL
jgi:hypothetical protein